MRKLFALLVILAVATSAFAFAASFSINSSGSQSDQENISSGSESIGACDSNIETDITGTWLDGTGFIVDTVWVNLNDNCVDTNVSVVLTNGSSGQVSSVKDYGPPLDSGAEHTFDFSDETILVEEVQGIEVQVDNTP